MYSYGSPHMAAQKQDDQHERTFSSYVRIQVAVLKTYLGRWTIGRSGERGSGISVLPARYDDDDVYFTYPYHGYVTYIHLMAIKCSFHFISFALHKWQWVIIWFWKYGKVCSHLFVAITPRSTFNWSTW